MKLLFGDSAARKVSERIGATVATMTALKAIPTNRAVDGMIVMVQSNYSLWQFHASSALTGDDVLVAEPSDSGAGAWLRMPGGVLLELPIVFGTLDAAILLTIPTGCLFQPHEFAWKVTTPFTGGTGSAIGVSSSNITGKTTKGDLLGGATGDVAATLIAGDPIMGTIGTTFATVANRRFIMKAADTLRFDRITSAFTAGAGSVYVAGNLLKNAGA